nr:hypothetical protein GCM10020241_36150 [Streptoalloteichus tenebrarius]
MPGRFAPGFSGVSAALPGLGVSVGVLAQTRGGPASVGGSDLSFGVVCCAPPLPFVQVEGGELEGEQEGLGGDAPEPAECGVFEVDAVVGVPGVAVGSFVA